MAAPSSAMRSERCEVLIVGAGPVGLLLALLLHQRGLGVMIVERQKALYPLPRAVLFDHEARRIFGSADLSGQVDSILENVIGQGGEEGINFVWRDAELKLIVDMYTEARTRSDYPSIMGFCQPQLESLLEKAILSRKIPLIRGYTLRHLEQTSRCVEAGFSEATANETRCLEKGVYSGGAMGTATTGSLADGSGTHELLVRASYLVGCDGANSTVRQIENFSVTTLNFENDWLILDLVCYLASDVLGYMLTLQLLRDGYVPPVVERLGTAQICDPRRPTTCVFGGPGRKRFEFMRLPGESRESLLQNENIWRLLEPWGFDKVNCDLERKVIYTFKARWANESFVNRIMLAGDAFHLMPPFIGQGLNSGFRDAAALAWRLPLLVSGVCSSQSLLKSYQSERLDHVRKLTEHCILLGEVVCETEPAKAKRLHEALRKQPPGKAYDPPLGKPGILTSQAEAGQLSLQRPLNVGGKLDLFDDIHGYGWFLINLGSKSVEGLLCPELGDFFQRVLGGQCVCISDLEDYAGEYKEWFGNEMGLDHAVLVRPDFYVFGHAQLSEVNALVADLRATMGVGVEAA